ncbi:hypothetical protein GCM10022284_15320 [Streptomyces hundungensis]
MGGIGGGAGRARGATPAEQPGHHRHDGGDHSPPGTLSMAHVLVPLCFDDTAVTAVLNCDGQCADNPPPSA